MNQKELIRTFKRLLYIVLLFTAAALVISFIERKEASPANQVKIEIDRLPDGNRMINEKDVLLTIERSFGFELEGLPLGSVDVERLERVLEEDPFILNADVFIDARNGVNIRIIQREPILRIIDNNGLNYYLDRDGFKMPLSKHFSARVLVATGNIPPHVPDFLVRDRHILKDLYLLSHDLRNNEFYNALIDQVYVSNRGELSLIPKVGKQKIHLGKYTNINDKLNRLKIFYQEGMPYEGWRKYSSIDLRYKGQVVCQK